MTRCERKLATPSGKDRCTKDAKYLYRWNRGEGDWKTVCAFHARLTPWHGERQSLTPSSFNTEEKS